MANQTDDMNIIQAKREITDGFRCCFMHRNLLTGFAQDCSEFDGLYW